MNLFLRRGWHLKMTSVQIPPPCRHHSVCLNYLCSWGIAKWLQKMVHSGTIIVVPGQSRCMIVQYHSWSSLCEQSSSPRRWTWQLHAWGHTIAKAVNVRASTWIPPNWPQIQVWTFKINLCPAARKYLVTGSKCFSVEFPTKTDGMGKNQDVRIPFSKPFSFESWKHLQSFQQKIMTLSKPLHLQNAVPCCKACLEDCVIRAKLQVLYANTWLK